MQYLGEAGLRRERYRGLQGPPSMHIDLSMRVRSIVAWAGDRRAKASTTAAGRAELKKRALRHVSRAALERSDFAVRRLPLIFA